MKKKWLIAIATSVMAVTVALGITACGENEGEEEPGKSDAEIAAEAIDTLKQVYPTTLTETPENYDLLGQVNVGGERYNVIWTATSDVEGIENYVAIAKEMDASKKFHVTITRGSIDVSYTMTASVTVGSETKTENFLRKIPKGLVADEGTVTVDFKDMDAGGGSFTDGAALALFNSMASEETPIESVSLTSVAHGNGTGAGSYQLAGGFVKMGTGSANGVLTLGFAYPVTKIEIEAQAWPSGSSTETLSVNSSEAQTIEKTAKSVYTFELANPTKDVTITTVGRVLVFKLAATWQKDVHHHTWTYTTGTNFQHTRTCTGADCTLTDKTETVDCQVVDSVCELCKKSYTQEEVVNALYELDSGASLPGTFVISGTVTEIEEAYSTTFYNTTFTINASGKPVKIFRAYGEICDEVEIKLGDIVTARGGLVNYSGDVYELSGGYITAVVDGSASMDDQTKVTSEKDNLTLDTSSLKKVDDSVTLPTAIYGTTLSWAISTNNYVKLEGGKLTVIALPESGTAEITVTATIKSGSVTETKEFKISIAAEGVSDFAPITAPAAGSDYYLAMDINGTWYYSTGAKDGNYLGTTTDISKAAKVTLAASGSGWTLVTNGKYIEFETSEPNSKGKTYVNIMLKDSQTTGKVWTWNEQHSVFTMDEGGATYFMGTYGTYNTFNSAKLDFIEGDDEHIGKIGTYTGTVTPEPEPSDADATLSFADTANRTELETDHEVWKQNGITFTKNKGTGYDIDVEKGYANPVRIYQNHIVTIVYTSTMTKVVFHCGTYKDNDYPGALQTSLSGVAGITVTVDELDVTVTFETAAASLEFTASAQIRLDSIDIYSDGGTASDEKTDEEKVNEVLASLQLPKTTFSSLPDDADLPTTNSYEAEVVWTVKDTTDLVKIEGNLLTVLKLPTEETTVKLHVVVTLNEATAKKDFDIKIEPAETTNYGTKDAPITVTQALAIAKALPTGKEDANYSAQAAYVKGYVVDIGTWTPASGSFSDEYKSAYIADNKESTTSSADAIQIYFLHVDDTFLKLSGDLIKGAELTVYGYIQHFAYTAGEAGTPEISDHNNVDVKAVAYTVTEQQKADAAVATIGDLNNDSVSEDITLPASPVTGVTFEWKVSDTEGTNAKIEGGKVVVTRTEADATVTLTLTATCGSATATGTYTLKIISSSAVASLTATMSYSGATANLGTTNGAATVNLDADIFTVTSEIVSGSNHIGLNKDGTIRVHANGAAKLHLSCTDAYVIESIKVTLAKGSKGTLENLKVEAGSSTVTGTEGLYAINGTTIALSSSGAQVQITSIVITYKPVG